MNIFRHGFSDTCLFPTTTFSDTCVFPTKKNAEKILTIHSTTRGLWFAFVMFLIDCEAHHFLKHRRTVRKGSLCQASTSSSAFRATINSSILASCALPSEIPTFARIVRRRKIILTVLSYKSHVWIGYRTHPRPRPFFALGHEHLPVNKGHRREFENLRI